MPKQREEAPILDPIEKDFMDAIDRLEANQPNNEELQKQARRKKLKINAVTVAKEAGHSRTLIYEDEYNRVKQRIWEFTHPAAPGDATPAVNRTSKDTIAVLRRVNNDIRDEKKLVLSALAAIALRMVAMSEAHEREIAKMQRTEKAANNPNQVIGTPKVANNVTWLPGPEPKFEDEL